MIEIGSNRVGGGNPVYVIAEIGINHNGSLEIARDLMCIAAAAGCNAVKFQKRDPDVCVPEDQKLSVVSPLDDVNKPTLMNCRCNREHLCREF